MNVEKLFLPLSDSILFQTISMMEPSLGNHDKIDCCRWVDKSQISNFMNISQYFVPFFDRLRESEMTPCLQVFNQRSLEFAYQKFVQKKSQNYALISFMVSFLGILVTIVSRTKWYVIVRRHSLHGNINFQKENQILMIRILLTTISGEISSMII